MQKILNWIENKIKATSVSITATNLSKSDFWFYDLYNGRIINRKNSFFSIYGAEYIRNGTFVMEQPIIIQNEIGYLGIIYKLIDKMPYFYMQAKIEPGNVNVVQISPTIQATKSNFTRAHGGKLPMYFEIFEQSKGSNVIYDQVQPEQTTRFYKKFNRNLLVNYDDVCELKDDDNFRWISYIDLLKLFKINNLVNMDTRTVISGFPIKLIDKKMLNLYWYNSFFSNDSDAELNNIFHSINNFIMFNNDRTILKPLYELREWGLDDNGIFCKKLSNFDVKYFDICISGREVHSWSQPLFCSKGKALFGLIIKKYNDQYKILISIRKFIGSHNYEFAPTIQKEFIEIENDNINDNIVDRIFFKYLNSGKNIISDIILSEEGGRFYQEQNRNVIIEIDDDFELPECYYFVSLKTIKELIAKTNLVNIQLRNLISIIDIFNYHED